MFLKKQGIYQETVCLIAAEEKKPVTLTQEIQGTNYLISAYPMITKINKNSRVQKETNCTYNVFNFNENKYIQFDTYGTSERKSESKSSQTKQYSLLSMLL